MNSEQYAALNKVKNHMISHARKLIAMSKSIDEEMRIHENYMDDDSLKTIAKSLSMRAGSLTKLARELRHTIND